jgi:hypothetical protein
MSLKLISISKSEKETDNTPTLPKLIPSKDVALQKEQKHNERD